MLVFVVLDLVLSCSVIVVSPVVGASIVIYMSLSIPFPFWVATEQKGGQG